MTDGPDLSEFDFDLPETHIALRPAEPRDSSRLLVVHGDGRLEDRTMLDLPGLLRPGDGLVFNDTRVLPAALKGIRPARGPEGSDVSVDVNLVQSVGSDVWRALARPGKRLKTGDRLAFAADLSAQVMGKGEGGEITLTFNKDGDALVAALETYGAMPLPPYIARKRPADADDRNSYQTVYAAGDAKSVAAPTAGLHFTDRLMKALEVAEIERVFVRLHVGMGTFAPLGQDQIAAGKLHEEWCELSAGTAAALNELRQAGGRCVAVGTTALRTLESAVRPDGTLAALRGETDIFIKPGYRFGAVDGLLTNFHLPRSSLFMLVCALMGTDIMQSAYAHAIAEDYRFYSYGDACLLLP